MLRNIRFSGYSAEELRWNRLYPLSGNNNGFWGCHGYLQ